MSHTGVEYMKTMNSFFYDQVKTADQKAAYVFTFLTILFVFSKDPKAILIWLHEPPSLSLTWILSLILTMSACFSLLCAGLVVLPRSKSGGASLYWGAWNQPGGYVLPAVIEDAFVIEEYKTNVRNLAHICQVKYRFVGLAFRGAFFTILIHIWLLALSVT